MCFVSIYTYSNSNIFTMAIIACKISLPVTVGEEKQDKVKADRVLNNLRSVGVSHNRILDAIMCNYAKWEKSPIVWVENCAYKIKLLNTEGNKVYLLQMPLQISYKNNGKETYHIICKRKVEITFA